MQNGGNRQALSQLAGAGDEMEVLLTFEGISQVELSPDFLDPETLAGWFYPQAIQEAVHNQEQGTEEGYYFGLNPGLDLQSGGDFGYIESLLISQHPTVEIRYPQGNLSQLQNSLLSQPRLCLGLFGQIRLGEEAQTPYTSHIQEEANGVRVQFSPPPLAAVPANQQRAFVIGARVNYPGAKA